MPSRVWAKCYRYIAVQVTKKAYRIFKKLVEICLSMNDFANAIRERRVLAIGFSDV